MQSKTTTTNQIPQHLIAGINLKNSTDVELFGIKKNMTVQFFQSGQVHYFQDLKPNYFIMLLNRFNSDMPAKEYFRKQEEVNGEKMSLKRKVEIYAYFLFGALDHKPDFKNGVLQGCENFRDSDNCPSLNFAWKNITMDGASLTKRDLTIIDMSARGCTDFEIADTLNIAIKTLDSHKAKLFVKTNTKCKLDLVCKSFHQQVIQ